MRVGIALGIALLLVIGGFVLDMSGRATRIAGSDHINPLAFVATVPSDGTLCQPDMTLPAVSRTIEVLIGTYGHPVPSVKLTFVGARAKVVASGSLAYGAHEGYIQIPFHYPHGSTAVGSLCLQFGRAATPFVLGGETFPQGSSSERVDGSSQGGRIDVMYLRPRRESWWELLPALDERFGLGKAAIFGNWTLPAMALLLLAVWIAVMRLLLREMKI